MDEYWTLIGLLGDGYMNEQFHVTASFGADDGTDMHTVDFDAKLKGDNLDASVGSEPMTIKLDLDIIGRITRDGLDPLGTFKI